MVIVSMLLQAEIRRNDDRENALHFNWWFQPTHKTQFENRSKDLYVRTTVRELILYLIFLINLCIMSLSKLL